MHKYIMEKTTLSEDDFKRGNHILDKLVPSDIKERQGILRKFKMLLRRCPPQEFEQLISGLYELYHNPLSWEDSGRIILHVLKHPKHACSFCQGLVILTRCQQFEILKIPENFDLLLKNPEHAADLAESLYYLYASNLMCNEKMINHNISLLAQNKEKSGGLWNALRYLMPKELATQENVEAFLLHDFKDCSDDFYSKNGMGVWVALPTLEKANLLNTRNYLTLLKYAKHAYGISLKMDEILAKGRPFTQADFDGQIGELVRRRYSGGGLLNAGRSFMMFGAAAADAPIKTWKDIPVHVGEWSEVHPAHAAIAPE